MAKNTMSEEARAKWNAYQKEYRRKNPERARQWTHNYILKKAARLQATRTISTARNGPGDVGQLDQGGQCDNPDD